MKFALCCLAIALLAPAHLGAEDATVSISQPISGTSAVSEGEDLRALLDYMWVLIAAALVFCMQAGFMCLESGVARAKNNINVAIKNMGDLVIAVCGFWILGFGLMFGSSAGGWIGTDLFFVDIGDGDGTPWIAIFFVFQAMFVGTAATIDSGVIAERTKFSTYLVISFFASCLIYPIFGHWAWGSLLNPDNGGWLADLGFLDFAGSTVVHATGAWIGLAAAIVIGARIGKFDPHGKPRKIHASSLPLMYLGTFLLFFGWFGFNCGSTLAATTDVAKIAFNTVIAAVFGGLAAGALGWLFHEDRVMEAEFIANGVLGGLVGITAGCDALDAWSSCTIGLVAGCIVYGGTKLLEHKLRIDDVVGAIPVHGMCGAWGTIGLALLMPNDALPEHGRMSQILIQMLGVFSNFIWAFGITFILLKIVMKFMPLRVPLKDEEAGLNVAEHGATSSLLELAHSMERATGAERIEADMKVHVDYGTEVGELGQCFNTLLDTIIAQQIRVEAELTHSKKMTDQIAESGERELERQRQQQELQEKVADYQQREVGSLRSALAHLADGNLEAQYVVQPSDSETEAIAAVFSDISEAVRHTAENLGRMMNQAKERAQLMQMVARNIADQSIKSQSVSHQAVDGSERASEMMKALTGAAGEIADVIKLISNIAEQTNMLALNANIEASQAGEAGKGFAIVASEIKELADRTGRASQAIQEKVSSITDGANNAKDAMDQVKTLIESLNNMIAEIVASANSDLQ